MIGCIYGAIRSGKSYHAVSDFIIPALKKGQRVVTNISGLKPELFRVLHGVDDLKLTIISDDQVMGFWKPYLHADGGEGEAGVLFIIDEIQNFYGSSNWRENKTSREELKLFLTKCGHYLHSVVYICQVPRMVHVDVTDLTENFIKTQKINFIKFIKDNKYVYTVRNGYKGKDGSTVLKTGFRKYDPKVFVCYESAVIGGGETKTAFDTPGWLPTKALFALFLGLVILVGWKVFFYKGSTENASQTKAASIDKKVGSTVTVNSSGVSGTDIIIVDGWAKYDSCINWLIGASPVARSCPDSGRRYGFISAGQVQVRYKARPVSAWVGSGEVDRLGSAPSGVSGGPVTADR